MIQRLVCLAVLSVPAAVHAQSVQIVQGDHAGSGSVVWRYTNYPNYGQVLTCWHVIQSSDPVGVVWKMEDGTRGNAIARVLASDKNEDIAALESYIGDTPAVVVAPTTPPIGSKVFICGYGENIYNERAASIQAIENGYIRLDKPSRHGDSGGAIIYDQKVVGICVMLRRADYDGLAVPAEKIRSFLTHNAGWKFDPKSIGLPTQESQPPPQPQPQQAPPRNANSRGGSVVRIQIPDAAPPSETPAGQRGPQPPASSPPGAPPAGQSLTPPASALGAKQPAAGNQPPLIPLAAQQNRVAPTVNEPKSPSRFHLSTIVMMSMTGISVTACLVVVVVMMRARKSAAQSDEADDDPDDDMAELRQTGPENDRKYSGPANGFRNDDEWHDFWSNRPGAASPTPDNQQRQNGKTRRQPPPPPFSRPAPSKKPKLPES